MSDSNQNPEAGGKRGLLVAGGIVVVLAGAGLYSRLTADRSEPLTLEQRYEQDSRLRPLLFDCPFGRAFDRDTSDLIPVMVSKLNRGERAPLRAFKQELARIGAPAVPELRRLFDDAYSEGFRTGVVENVLGVCALMDSDAGVEMARLAMEHPRGSVRLAALDALSRHGNLEDYDLVRGWLERTNSPQEGGDYMRTLTILDGPRFYREFAGFLEEGTFAPAWLLIATRLHGVYDPEIIQRYMAKALQEDTPNQIVPFLLGPAAREGNAEALAALRERLTAERDTRVQFTLEALRRVGLGAEAAPVLLKDERAPLRKLAAEIIAELPVSEESTQWLTQGLSDTEPGVRGVCLTALIRRGDSLAESQALALLSGNTVERRRGIEALTGMVESTPFKAAVGTIRVGADLESAVAPPLDFGKEGLEEQAETADALESSAGWAGTVELAQRAFEVLSVEYARVGDRPTRMSVLKAIGRVPLADSAEFLLDCAADLGSVGELSGLRWCAGQAFNTGPQGQAVLRERLALEVDPMRRLDLIEFVWQDHSEASRELLLEILAAPDTNEYERVYVAGRLTRMLAAGQVAPRIKQAYLANTHQVARPGLQCILWTWYGQHDA